MELIEPTDYVSYLGGDTALSLYLFNFVFSTIDKY